ncbi:hypothetical protein L596_011111 [Steinernema carpocapsae]|uniref:Uncharacterized protein n=1 Tax=Steinernema carpocapsae TaxID=34508 RepID=A0A4U5NTR0_STECR|nr:hypothetical protein L596_011111 [Steinernema carpocapsae]
MFHIQQQGIPSSTVIGMTAGQPQTVVYTSMHQPSGLLGQPPPQSNPSISVMPGFVGSQMNPNSPMVGSVGSVHLGSVGSAQMSAGSVGGPGTPHQQAQLSVPANGEAAKTPSPNPPTITNPPSQQPPMSNQPGSVLSDHQIGSVTASTPGPSTASTGEGNANSEDSEVQQDYEMPPWMGPGDVACQARDMILTTLRTDITNLISTVCNYYHWRTGTSPSDMPGQPASVAAPDSVNDQNLAGPSSVNPSDDQPHSAGQAPLSYEEKSENFQNQALENSMQALATVDSILSIIDIARKSFDSISKIERMVQCGPMATGTAGGPGNESTLVISQQANDQLVNQDQLHGTVSNAVDSVMSLLNAMRDRRNRGEVKNGQANLQDMDENRENVENLSHMDEDDLAELDALDPGLLGGDTGMGYL